MKALACEVPDRVPISTYELVGYNSTAFENNQPSYKSLMDFIRDKTDCIAMWNPVCNARFLMSAYPVEANNESIREGDATVTRQTIHTPKGDFTCTAKHIDGVHTTWRTERLCKSVQDVDRALSVPYVSPTYNASDYERILSEVGDRGIIMASLGDALCHAAELMEFGEYTIWAMTEESHFAKTIQALHERVMDNLERMLEINVVDLYRICGPEYATPPYLPPRYFKRYVEPYVAEMVALMHQKGAKARLHCHGKVGHVLDMIAATGADGLDPCEAPPDGDVTLAEIKNSIGSKVCLFGNLQLKLIEHGSTEEIAHVVMDCMNAAKAAGGYVIMPTAAPINVPLAPKTEDNYRTFIETALECGEYQ